MTSCEPFEISKFLFHFHFEGKAARGVVGRPGLSGPGPRRGPSAHVRTRPCVRPYDMCAYYSRGRSRRVTESKGAPTAVPRPGGSGTVQREKGPRTVVVEPGTALDVRDAAPRRLPPKVVVALAGRRLTLPSRSQVPCPQSFVSGGRSPSAVDESFCHPKLLGSAGHPVDSPYPVSPGTATTEDVPYRGTQEGSRPETEVPVDPDRVRVRDVWESLRNPRRNRRVGGSPEVRPGGDSLVDPSQTTPTLRRTVPNVPRQRRREEGLRETKTSGRGPTCTTPTGEQKGPNSGEPGRSHGTPLSRRVTGGPTSRESKRLHPQVILTPTGRRVRLRVTPKVRPGPTPAQRGDVGEQQVHTGPR